MLINLKISSAFQFHHLNLLVHRVFHVPQYHLKKNILNLKGIDGIVGHNQDIVDYFIWANNNYNLGIKKISRIAPSWDEERIKEALVPKAESREDFFKKSYG